LDWRVSITVNFSVEVEKKVVCKGSVIYAGFFDVSETVTVESRQKFVAAHGASVLYAATRELIANLTSRSPNLQHMVLPVASFSNLQLETDPTRKAITATGV
jgi:preprotein translocase subunit SecB